MIRAAAVARLGLSSATQRAGASPETLALLVAKGAPAARIKASVTGQSGMRKATLPSAAANCLGKAADAANTSVKAPGQFRSANS
jgi:hypothetical protein